MQNISHAFTGPYAEYVNAANRGWSQQFEDELFARFFLSERRSEDKLRGGIYVELGANDGAAASNTRKFYEANGWRGLLVEASPPLCDRLSQNRPGDVVMCGAVCDATFGGSLKFSTTSKGAGTLVGHAVDQGAAASWSTQMTRLHKLEVVTVPCMHAASRTPGHALPYPFH